MDYWVNGLHGPMNKELGSVSNQDNDGDKIVTNLTTFARFARAFFAAVLVISTT